MHRIQSGSLLTVTICGTWMYFHSNETFTNNIRDGCTAMFPLRCANMQYNQTICAINPILAHLLATFQI